MALNSISDIKTLPLLQLRDRLSAAALTSIRAPRPALLDLNTFEGVDFPATPTAWQRGITVEWKNGGEFASASRSLHYTGTTNQTLRIEVETLIKDPGEWERVDDFVRFLEAACWPAQTRGRSGSRQTAPSTLLFSWPEEVVIECVLTSFSDSGDKFFQRDGRVRRRRISLDFIELLDGVVTKETVRRNGSRGR
jgi:hypothetical protein